MKLMAHLHQILQTTKTTLSNKFIKKIKNIMNS